MADPTARPLKEASSLERDLSAAKQALHALVQAADRLGLRQGHPRGEGHPRPRAMRCRPRHRQATTIVHKDAAFLRNLLRDGDWNVLYIVTQYIPTLAAQLAVGRMRVCATVGVFQMVHPYLRRRAGEEAIEYPSEDIRIATERTLGIPLFQEQVMQIAMLAADFTAGEADQLCRAMGAWRKRGGLEVHQRKLVERMLRKGYEEEFAERIAKQIEGFGSYGFPESHAASFALLVYVSWAGSSATIPTPS